MIRHGSLTESGKRIAQEEEKSKPKNPKAGADLGCMDIEITLTLTTPHLPELLFRLYNVFMGYQVF